MNRILTMRSKRILCTAMAVLMMMMISAPVTVHATAPATGSPVYLTINQVFSATSSPANNTFTYRLSSLNPDNPNNPALPGGATEGYTFTIAGNESTTIGPIDFRVPDVYRYEIIQVIDEEKPGYIYDWRAYTIVIHVDASYNATIIVYNENNIKEEQIVFVNGYSVLPSDPNLMMDPPVMKTVSGNPSYDSDFAFKLVAQDASYPMPSGSSEGEKMIYVKGSGQAVFGTWSYDKEGIYYYYVYEVNSALSGYTYDTTVYSITDNVKEENGQLVVTRVVSNEINKSVSSMIFNNRYKTGGGTINPPVTTTTPKITETPSPTPTPTPTETPTRTGSPGRSTPRPSRGPGQIDPTEPADLGERDDDNVVVENNDIDLENGGVPIGNTNIDSNDDDPPRGGINLGIRSPRTGDDSNTNSHIIMLVAGGLLAFGSAMYLFVGERRRRRAGE
ncbi:MAG: hypothetical protein FWH52_01865 [Synergistaceae bacterium]|nr:hypothetical protein [Synergistaceae bacterium]